LRWGDGVKWRRLEREIYLEGADPPDPIDVARARVLAANTAARGGLAGVLLGLDSVVLDRRPTRRRLLPPERIVSIGGINCADGLQTLIDLASLVDDSVWEHALESALRTKLVTITEVEGALDELGRARTPGTARVRRVLALRPPGAPPTESLLETLMVQLIRLIPDLRPPTRQYRVVNAHGEVIARVDLCWPELGLFIELDGQHHEGQPVHDSSRETAIVIATGWLVGRFTWREVVDNPRVTVRRLASLVEQARRRPMPELAS